MLWIRKMRNNLQQQQKKKKKRTVRKSVVLHISIKQSEILWKICKYKFQLNIWIGQGIRVLYCTPSFTASHSTADRREVEPNEFYASYASIHSSIIRVLTFLAFVLLSTWRSSTEKMRTSISKWISVTMQRSYSQTFHSHSHVLLIIIVRIS